MHNFCCLMLFDGGFGSVLVWLSSFYYFLSWLLLFVVLSCCLNLFLVDFNTFVVVSVGCFHNLAGFMVLRFRYLSFWLFCDAGNNFQNRLVHLCLALGIVIFGRFM